MNSLSEKAMLLEEVGFTQQFNDLEPFQKPDTDLLPDFPIEVLPEALATYIQAVSAELQVSVDMAASLALGTIATCVQGKFRINPKPGWYEPLNLYMSVIARPSERKSPTVRHVLFPVYAFTKEENKRRAPAIAEYRLQKNILQKKITNMSDAVAKNKKHSTDDISQIQQELASLEEVKPLRLVADDATPEALVSLMYDNNECISVISTEGGIFDIIAGRYESKPNMDIYLKGYSGDYMHIDRKGRESETLEHPTLTMVLTIQPYVLDEIMRNDSFKGKGLLARFLYSFPRSTIGGREYDTPPTVGAARDEYDKALYRLLWVEHQDKPQVLTLDDNAKALAKSYFYEIEPQLVGNLEEIEEWAGKLHGNTMRIAGILHCFRYGAESAKRQMEGDTMQSAIHIGRYFTEHSKVAFRLMGAADRQEESDAKYIWKRLQSVSDDQISKRDLIRLCRKFSKSEDMNDGISLLISKGYIRVTNVTNVSKGGRPAETIHINPEARQL